MFSIGEFSRITGLTVKTLRFYHDEGILPPAHIDPQSGYRYYDQSQIDPARLIARLRAMEFPLASIRDILPSADDPAALQAAIEKHRSSLQSQIKHFRNALKSLDAFLTQEMESRAMAQTDYAVEEKNLEPLTIASIRMKGRYSDCGRAFARIGRAFGRHIAGPCMLLHHDDEYKEADADFEAAFPIKKGESTPEITVKQLPPGRCISLLHRGPYDQLGHSYAKILQHARDKGYEILMPTREVYLKGPGMIFKGKPKNYLTEIQMLVNAKTSIGSSR